MAQAPHGDISRRVDANGQTWFNGNDAVDLALRGFDLTTLAFDDDDSIQEYNRWCDLRDKHDRKIMPPDRLGDPCQRAADWWISEPYRSLDVRHYVLQRCAQDEERARVHREMDMYEQRKLEPLLRLMIMLVDHFREKNIVWGVGRGSSVASYVLFLIGIHKIDSLFYKLDIEEFLR